MIFFTNRSYETLAVASAETDKGLVLLDDSLNQTVKKGTAIYTAKISKNDRSVEKIEAGYFVFVPNFRNKIIVLEIMEVKETRTYKEIVAEDAGLELINADSGDHNMKGTLRDHIIFTIGKDSDWTIGIDEIGDSKNLTLEYKGVSNQTKRIVQIAGRFGAEVSYDFVFEGNKIKEKRINFYKERGRNTALRLEVGKELKEVKRNISITNLRTAILGIGKPHKETVKTTKTVSKPIEKKTVVSTGKIDPFINWFKSRQGKVTYSMYNRMGPYAYDCSSAVHFAAKHAGLIPPNQYIGSTETLFAMKGKYLDEISRSDIRIGDIFIAGRQGASGGAAGHTGAVINKNQIIHCSYSRNGIAITPIDGGYTGGPPVRWFRWRNSGYGTVSQAGTSKKYWTNSDITKHDLGFKLNGLTADNLNNWIRATNPNCPFVGQGSVFIEAQKQSGLDARYILAHAALESAWGKSNIAKKYNNYFGIGAFDNDPDNARNFSNSGLASGIINGAKWIAKNYYNSSYKQTTLYKMRNNNGVHQYATDPYWHTKIANIMKKSERYTNPSDSTVSKETKVVESQVDKDTNLIGYKYDDGRYFVDSEGRVCDREANSIWAKPNSKGKYLTRIYESEATSQKTLFNECLAQLKKNNEAEVSYEVNPDKIPKDINIGDRVRIIDHDFSPALYLEARLVDVTYSITSEYINKAVFANFVPKTSGIAESLYNIQRNVKEYKYEWKNQPYSMEISSSSGNVFKDDIIETDLIATVTKAGIDQSANIDGFIWERISKYQDKLAISDDDWNESKKDNNEHFIELNRSDIELEASFVCSAIVDGIAVASASYTIKNFSLGIYKQEEEPDRKLLKWGDIWQWDNGEGKHFKRIWKGDKWEDVITKRDLDLLELTPGPPGADGKDGMPGEPGADGRTSYMHFAYADSYDGTVGFVLTATEGKKYIGFYTDFEKEDSKDPKKYEWSKYVGDDGKPGKDGQDGIPGKAGADGKTPYFHTAWANSSDGSKDFSVSQAGEKAYIGTYTDYVKEDSQDPKKYTWQLVKGNKGDKGDRGLTGAKGEPGADGKDGKTGKIGQNLLRNSNIEIESSDYRTFATPLCETPDTGETMTFTAKIKSEKDDSIRLYNSGGMINLTDWIEIKKSDDYQIISTTFKWVDKNTDKYIQSNPPVLYAYIDSNRNSIKANKVLVEWAVLTRGDIPAIEWSPCYADVDDAISEKASEESLQDLQIHFAMYPTAEELNQNKVDLIKQQAYLDQLKTAIDSNALSLEDRLSIIEASVGAGKVSLEAINTYLHFGEEGVLIGKEGEQVRLRLINNALEITDGTKVVARFANNQTETPNLKVSGAFEFGYHVANKVDLDGDKYTVISANI